MHLLVFKTVADKGSFSRAAEALHLSQPAVSLAVQALEQQYGTKLLHRTHRGTSLTEEGKVLYNYACQLVELYEAAEQALQEYRHTPRGRLAVGASQTIGDYIMPRLSGAFVEQYPEISLTMEVANTRAIIHRLVEQTIEIALVEFLPETPGVIGQPFLQDELVVTTGMCHPWAGRQRVSLGELQNEPFIAREEGSGSRKFLEEKLNSRGISLADFNVRLTLGSNQAIKEVVQGGLGIAIISQWAVQKECSFGLVHTLKLKDFPLTHPFYVALKNHPLTLPARLFLELLQPASLNEVLSATG